MEEITLAYTPEQVGKGVETVVGFGAYPIATVAAPGVGLPVLLASETIAAHKNMLIQKRKQKSLLGKVGKNMRKRLKKQKKN